MVKVYEYSEIDAPALLKEALDDDFFIKTKLERIPVLIMNNDNEEWAGFCRDTDHTEFGEIVISRALLTQALEPRFIPKKSRLQYLYAHECCHRLLPNFGHNEMFLALILLLTLRLDNQSVNRVDHYDFKESKNIAKAWEWAWGVAHELLLTDLSAENAALEIIKRFEAWQKYLSQKEDSQMQLETENEALKSQIKQLESSLKRHIKTAERSVFEYGLIGLILGAFLVSITRLI